MFYDNKKHALKNSNFLFLWQGQFISSTGDVLYEVALGFFLLQEYKSSALMAAVVAVSAVPGIIISPFAGVLIDRVNKKYVLLAVDFFRGIAVTVMAVWIYLGHAPIWLFFATGLIISVGGAFFMPCMKSLLPQIIEREHLMRANSIMNIAYQTTEMGGNSAGGFIYQFSGAKLMFLLDGISYLISGFLLLFLKVDADESEMKPNNVPYLTDLKSGLVFTLKFKGLKYMIIMASCLNFFAGGASILLKSLFAYTPELGIEKYGIAIGAICAGNILGMLFSSIVEIPCQKRLIFFIASAMVDSLFNAAFPFVSTYIGYVMLCSAGFANSIINMLILSSVQQCVPGNMRGKVFSLISMVSHGISPIAIASAGIVAQLLNIKFLIFTCYLINILVFVFFAFRKPFRSFICFNPTLPIPTQR